MTDETPGIQYADDFSPVETLITRVGHKMACEMLGVSDLLQMLKKQQVRVAYVLAAQYQLGLLEPEARLYMVRVPSDEDERFLTMAKLFNANFTPIDMDWY